MGPSAWFTLAVVIATVLALAREWVAPSIAVVGAMVVLLVTGVVSPQQAFAGFSNPAPITVAALFVLARAVEKTGVSWISPTPSEFPWPEDPPGSTTSIHPVRPSGGSSKAISGAPSWLK